ncbi:MAG TPA: hypothetical protein VG028_12815 [Terriglobia bacterium]|nr:hypothetical protein [Terriglobia bacterium]
MSHQTFEPVNAAREDKRQANEALGRSFCKTVAEAITNSDSSAKRKYNLPHSSGLVELMLATPKGTLLDTSAMKSHLAGKYLRRSITLEVVTNKSHGRPPGQIVIVDQAEGMSSTTLRSALDEIGGDKLSLSGGTAGRNLFGRGLSDFLRAHFDAKVSTYDGRELTTAIGGWPSGKRWRIEMDSKESPTTIDLKESGLTPGHTGTLVSCVVRDRTRCHIPDDPNIVHRLTNFYMLRLIAADPNVNLSLVQYRSAPAPTVDQIKYDFPVGQVIESFSKTFTPSGLMAKQPIMIDFLLARSDRKLRGLDTDRDARESGLMIVDDLDAVYDLTFADSEYEKADFLQHLYGIVRVHGLRKILEGYLNSPDFPTSPLRVDRDGFNGDHEFSRELLGFISGALKPYYERERHREEEKSKGRFSVATKKRIDDALKQLNKYFNEITGKTGPGGGTSAKEAEEPSELAVFLPKAVRLVAGRPRNVLLLVREDIGRDGGELCASASEGISVQPEVEQIDKRSCPRLKYAGWIAGYMCFRFSVGSDIVGHNGAVTALVDSTTDPPLLEAKLIVEDVLTEPEVAAPEKMEFRPTISLGRPGRRNNLVLYANTSVIALGHWIRVRVVNSVGDVFLIDGTNARCDQLDAKLMPSHQVPGQNVARLLIPWCGTAWNQRAEIEATVKVGPDVVFAKAKIRLDEPDANDGGFFKDVKYTELDGDVPSQYAAGTITVNTRDSLNREVFGKDQPDFEESLLHSPVAQQRLASLLVEEGTFRALEELRQDNKLHLPTNREVAGVHQEVDRHKFKSALGIFKALVK